MNKCQGSHPGLERHEGEQMMTKLYFFG